MKLPRLLLATLLPLTAVAPAADPVPDFSTADINAGSNRRRATALPVSPRNYLHQVTGWYFGAEG